MVWIETDEISLINLNNVRSIEFEETSKSFEIWATFNWFIRQRISSFSKKESNKKEAMKYYEIIKKRL